MAHGAHVRVEMPGLLAIVPSGPRRCGSRTEPRDDCRQHSLDALQILFRRHRLLDHGAELLGLGPGLRADPRVAGAPEQREAELVTYDDAIRAVVRLLLELADDALLDDGRAVHDLVVR